jgi:Chaperone of endosialidase
MNRWLAVTACIWVCHGGAALAQTCAAYPNTLTNGTTADASQVMANFAGILTCANTLLAPLASPKFTGSVGIGTSSPVGILNVHGGTTYIDNNAPNGDQIYIRGVSNPNQLLVVGYNITGNYGSIQAELAGTSPEPLVLNVAGGDVGIGTASPSYLLYVAGTAYASGAAGALSDVRHKDNVKALGSGALDVVERLRPVTFTWKKPADDGMKGEQIGFVAQDVQKVLPSVVLTENNAEKTLGIKYTELIPVLAKAIQEQQAEIEELRAELAALKGVSG